MSVDGWTCTSCLKEYPTSDRAFWLRGDPFQVTQNAGDEQRRPYCTECVAALKAADTAGTK